MYAHYLEFKVIESSQEQQQCYTEMCAYTVSKH